MALVLIRGTHTSDSSGPFTEVEHVYMGLQTDFTYTAATGVISASGLPAVGEHMDDTTADTVTEPIVYQVHVEPRPRDYPGFGLAVVRGRAPVAQSFS